MHDDVQYIVCLDSEFGITIISNMWNMDNPTYTLYKVPNKRKTQLLGYDKNFNFFGPSKKKVNKLNIMTGEIDNITDIKDNEEPNALLVNEKYFFLAITNRQNQQNP